MNASARLSTFALLGALVLAGAGLAGCGAEAVPDFVSYSRQIQPLMEARCVRCHGAGGTLNHDSDIDQGLNGGKPTGGYFNRLNDVGNGTLDATGNGFGLMHYTGTGIVTMKIYLALPMPPLPSAALSDRELELLLSWCTNPYP